jgi:flagellar biosynthesis protein FlhA
VGGLATRDPAFDLPATWIEKATRDQAEKFGYTLVEPVSVLATHLTEVVRRNADEILNRDATKHLIEELRKTSPTVVDDLIPERMKLVEVQQILQLLLREQVPIRQLAAILETLGEHAGRTRQPVVLVELARQRLARTISSRYCDKDNRLYVMTLEASLEDRIEENIEVAEGGISTRLPPHEVEAICSRIEDELDSPVWAHRSPVVLVSPRIRAALKQLTSGRLPRLVVLSYREITRDAQIESLAQIDDVLTVR